MLIEKLRSTPQTPKQYSSQIIGLDQLDGTSLQESQSNNYIESLQTLETTLWREREREFSTPEQLANFVRRSLIGVTIPSLEEDPTSKDAKMMDGLSKTLVSLMDPETQRCFLNWFTQELNGTNKEQSIYLLQGLLHTAMLLDLDSYGQMMKTKSGRISLIPLNALDFCVQLTNSTGESNDVLRNASNLFYAQYNNLLYNDKTPTEYSEIDGISLATSAPDALEIGDALLPWIDEQISIESISLEKGLRATLNYLKMYEAKGVESFFDLLGQKYGHENNAVITLRQRAIEYHHIKTTDEENKYVEDSGLQTTITKEIVDAAEVEYRNIIPANTETLFCNFLTGSVAPAHEGHLLTAEATLELNGERTRIRPESYGLLVVAPIVSPQTLEEKTSKSAAQVGPRQPRIDLLVITMRNLMNTYITTVMQREFIGEPMKRVSAIEKNFIRCVQTSFGTKKLPFNIVFERICGADKVLQRNVNGSFCVQEPEPAYADIQTVVFPRRAHLPALLQHLTEIQAKYPKATIVLGPGIPRDSSSLAISSENFTSVSSVGMRHVNGNWYRTQIRRREKEGPLEEPIYSVTEYGRSLEKQIRLELNLPEFV